VIFLKWRAQSFSKSIFLPAISNGISSALHETLKYKLLIKGQREVTQKSFERIELIADKIGICLCGM
jgi:hypothetical protein